MTKEEPVEEPKYAVGEVKEKDDNDKTNSKKDAPPQLASVGEVFQFGKGKFFFVFGGMFASIATGCVFPAMAWVFADSFQQIGGDANNPDAFMANIRQVAYTLMILGAIAFTAMLAQAALLEYAADLMTRDLKQQWFQALLRQDMAYYDIKDVSGTATVISSSGAKFKKGTGRKLGEMVQFTITFVGGLAYAFWSSWQASLIVLAVLPFMSLSALLLVKINTTQTARANETYAEAGGIVYSTVSSIRTILSLNAVPVVVQKFVTATQRAYEGAASMAPLLGLANGGLMGSFLLAYVGITLYGSFLLYSAVRESGCDPSGTVPGTVSCDPKGVDVFGALMGITFAAAVLPQVSVSVEAFTGARAACYSALEAMKRTVENNDKKDTEKKPAASDKEQPTDGRNHLPLPKYLIDSSSEEGLKPRSVDGELVFDNVRFAYPTRPETDVFTGFSLKVPAGKTVALVGSSGSGKSTSVQLLERFYDPSSGSITLDGNDLTALNVRWLRQQIGLVAQEPRLFACSIMENILYGKPDATREEVEQAARSANCHDFISAFPDGYDTQVGDKGAQLSGGQKQRIAIARVLIKQPKILLLDEATSALDSESESIVQEALDDLLEKGGRTTIVIAHRLSTVRNADMIAVVKEGRVVETGTHEELIRDRGHYHALVEAQKGKRDGDDGGSDTDSNPPSRSSSMQDLQAADDDDDDDFGGNVLMRFKDVRFRYPSRPENKIFRGLNLTIRNGETLALVGPSGHGKSTIIQLIERFYDPDSGTVELYGTDLKEINVSLLRNKLGLVSQEPTLFDTTIAENIRYGKPDATQKEIEEAAKMANIHDTIMDFTDKYETAVGEGGTQVSGGQKQRIAIARALVKQPDIMLLDEATSALDTASEKVVQEALDKIMASDSQTTVVIAHRLSTIRNADRIAVIADGKVREIGTHEQLMAKKGHYHRLQMYQDLDADQAARDELRASVVSAKSQTTKESAGEAVTAPDKSPDEIDKATAKKNAKRAWTLGSQDTWYFFVGGVGAIIAGLVFPGWGFIFAYMIELLYTPVFECENDVIFTPSPIPVESCQDYFDEVADDMRQRSFYITYGCLGTIAATMIGNMLLFYGFNIASERINKRVRDSAFKSLVRQEVGYFDLHPVAILTSRMADDAALLHSFSGEPIRTLIMNSASVLVGLVVSFVFMWPFALVTLAILPFMAFGAEMEMRMYMGEDESLDTDVEEHSPGSIVVETLLNIRTVASLAIEPTREKEFEEALQAENKHPFRGNIIKGGASGLGQFVQMWGMALMFWWGGYLLANYNAFTYRDFLISMFSLLFSLSGMAVAAQGATNREKAKLAADRIFEMMDRQSAIDPLDEGGASPGMAPAPVAKTTGKVWTKTDSDAEYAC